MSFEYTDSQKEAMNKIADYHLENVDKQFLQAIQELAELQVEITKWNLGKANFEEFLAEIHDADFMIHQLKRIMITRPKDFDLWFLKVNEKIERELMRHDL